MFKSTDGSKHFSFSRFINNAVPNLASAPIDTDLSTTELDALFTHQLTQTDFLTLSDQSFLHAGITTSPKTSASIHKALLKNGVLAQGAVNTSAIDKNFAHDLAIVTSHAQKKIVNVLFFWEEEGMRWRKLSGEKEELEVVIKETKEAGGDVGSYEKRLVEAEGEMGLRPSLRNGKGGEGLPGYEGQK
jgi:hypothetical protein